VLFQSAALFDSLTIYDNIAFPLLERLRLSSTRAHKKVLAIAESLSLTEYLQNYPEQVSIGIRKRVGMARALVTEPKVLLVDEPNTGLDPLDGQEVYDLINACKNQWGFTGLVISHELPEVFQVSERVAMILQGKIIAEGTPSEMIASADPAVQQFLNGRTDGPIKIQ
jgi:phospholipid/cholesterol/gamma-HCH transport system ATP-binding protein